MVTFAVLNRNFPASQYTVWPGLQADDRHLHGVADDLLLKSHKGRTREAEGRVPAIRVASVGRGGAPSARARRPFTASNRAPSRWDGPMTSQENMNGTVALVTGGSRGIGAATALRLAQEGADVAITYVRDKEAAEDVVRTDRGARAAWRSPCGRTPPTRRRPSVRCERAAEAFGRLDVLVNNVGVGLLGPLDSLSLADVDRVLAVNVRGVFLASQAAARALGRGGRIITDRYVHDAAGARARRHAVRDQQVGADRADEGAGA